MLGLADGNKLTWMPHKRFCKYLVPLKMNCTYLLNISTSVSVKFAVHPASHIYPIYNRLDDVMLLNTLAVMASFGRDGMPSWVISSDTMSAPLGQISLNDSAFDV